MKRIVPLVVLGSGLFALQAEAREPLAHRRASVQIAILLDTSNSMDGLIEQAKTQLWKVVNEFVRAKKDGRPPSLEVALFEYGKSSLPSEEGYVRLILPMTDDLDRVSEELFALRTNGGDEYCGWVIRDAVDRLGWIGSRDVYKAIFIAGNEPFTQGSVDFRKSCRAAIGRNIFVNTIFCGGTEEGIRTGWKDGAILADGRYMSIDQDQKVVDLPTPQDTEIAKLGIDLNKTYLPYGKLGQTGLMRQSAQDTNAFSLSASVMVNRSISKGGASYSNSTWDLVDAIKNGTCKLEDLKDEDLPDDLKKLDKPGRKAKLDDAARQRETIQSRILALSKHRDHFLAEERKKQVGAKDETLDSAIVKAIRSQATQYNFSFE